MDYEKQALLYAEKHGIIEYIVKGNEMIFYTSFPYEHNTYRANVNLDTLHETRTCLKRYYKAYKYRIGNRCEANYMA